MTPASPPSGATAAGVPATGVIGDHPTAAPRPGLAAKARAPRAKAPSPSRSSSSRRLAPPLVTLVRQKPALGTPPTTAEGTEARDAIHAAAAAGNSGGGGDFPPHPAGLRYHRGQPAR